jgi:2-hydroxychromene-2-carboxylate isomerase
MEILNPTLLSMKRDGEPVNYETKINRRNYQYLDRNKFTNTHGVEKSYGCT